MKILSYFRLTFRRMHRILSAFLCAITIVNIFESEASYKVTSYRDKILHGCNFQNTSETTVGNCLAKCLENCTCRSFQMCQGDDKTCSLCLSHNSSLVIEDSKGSCGYFVLERNQAQNGAMVQKSCVQDTNCCLTSKPCLHNGLCIPSYPSDILHSPRFTCACAPGYRGNRCEQPIKSCRGYINNIADNKVPASGKYTIIDDMDKPFVVFCDFNSSFDATTIMSWTLIQSYHLLNKGQFRKPFYTNHPKNEDTPPHWQSYRLSKSRMVSIQKDSSKWRMTCRYETDGLNYTDYMEGLKTEVDILSFKDGSACKNVEFINVRGYNCAQCEAMIRQKSDWPFHHDSYRSFGSCMFKPGNSKSCNIIDGVHGEDNFGQYMCVNSAHRCSVNEFSTTQTWLGSGAEHASYTTNI